MIARIAAKLRRRSGINKVVLSGGVFQNRFLTEKTVQALEIDDFKVFTHSNIPANDLNIPIGQVAIANARMRCV